MSHLLEVKNLQTHFPTRAGLVRAVNGVSFYIDTGELLGVVGESGCGKSITALSIMRLIAPPGKIVGGEITFDGKNLLKLSDAEMRQIRVLSKERITGKAGVGRLLEPIERLALFVKQCVGRSNEISRVMKLPKARFLAYRVLNLLFGSLHIPGGS